MPAAIPVRTSRSARASRGGPTARCRSGHERRSAWPEDRSTVQSGYNLLEHTQCLVYGGFRVRERDEVVRRAFEQQAPIGGTPGNGTGDSVAGELEKTHLGHTAH